MKKIFLFAAIAIMFFNGCKKDKPEGAVDNTVKINAEGNYVLTSVINTNVAGTGTATYTSLLTPCLANNKAIFKRDGTSGSSYAGVDSCYVFKSTQVSLIIGLKGEFTTSTWSQKGDVIKLNVLSPYTTTSYGHISKTGNTVQIVFRDTVKSIGTIAVSTYTKQ